MNRYLLMFSLATLLMVGLSMQNKTIMYTSVDFPTEEQTLICQTDDSYNMNVTREVNSLFTCPYTLNSVAEENSSPNLRIRSSGKILFIHRLQVRALSRFYTESPSCTIACNGVFVRPSDYYVYTLRRIVI